MDPVDWSLVTNCLDDKNGKSTILHLCSYCIAILSGHSVNSPRIFLKLQPEEGSERGHF